jgi:hypothetical protein
MKVYIGPYTRWIGPYQIADKIFFWVNKNGIYADDPPIFSRWDYKLHEKFGHWLADIEWLNNLCNWIESKKERKIKVRIDNYDTWSMDHTLAIIIHPMLVQLRECNHGYFTSDPEDVPSIGKGDEVDFGHNDSLAYERYKWIMDELIWTFDQLKNDNDYELFYKGKAGEWDREAMNAHHERIKNGLRLFGKYYRALWD